MTPTKNYHASSTGKVNNSYEWTMSQKLILNGETINSTSEKASYKAMVEIATKVTSIKLILIILRNYRRYTVTYHSYQKE